MNSTLTLRPPACPCAQELGPAESLEDADLEEATPEKPEEEPPEDLGEVNTKAFIKVLCKGTR